ncbi:hypothetical protein EBZ39_01205 [bacterium]|nr:hypothetical protein [bacterium]
MPCPDFQLSTTGRQGLGVVQPQSGLNYPLVNPTADIEYLIADFHFEYDDIGEYNNSVAPVKNPISIRHLYGVGCVENMPAANFPTPAHDADIVLVDALNRVVLDTTTQPTTFDQADWSQDYKIYTWKTANSVCRLVAHKTWPMADQGDDDAPRNYNKYLTPVNAQLDARAVYKMPKRLLTLRVQNGQTISNRYVDAVNFVNGYNTEIAAEKAEVKNFRINTEIKFSAVAGTGLGRYGNCPETPAVPISKINGVTGANGDFNLSAKDCLFIRRGVTVSVNEPHSTNPSLTSHQQIGANCDPCCACSDYSDTAKYMNDTSYRYKLIGQRAEKVRTEHENNIARWLDQRACSVQRPLRLFMVPQRCAYVDIVMMLCNPCQICVAPTRLTLTVDVSGDFVPAPGQDPATLAVRPSLECGYTFMRAPGVRGAGVGITVSPNGLQYSVAFPTVKPGESAYAQFRLRFDQIDLTATENSVVKPRGPYVINGVLTGVYLSDNSPLLTNCGDPLDDQTEPPAAIAETTQTLYCNSDGKTEAPC